MPAQSQQTVSRLQTVLDESNKDFTRSDRLIAAYLKDNLTQLPFETGAAISERIGVSEMSFIRFVRKLGYKSLREIKDELRSEEAGPALDVDDALDRFRVRNESFGDLAESLDLQVQAIAHAYQLTTLNRWQTIVDLLAHREKIFVVGFQASKGIALDFATRLEYARDRVRYIESTSGVFSELLEMDPGTCCLVQFDTVAYAKKGMLLAERAKNDGIPMVIISDHFSNWAYEYTDLVLQGHTQVNTFWDSAASLSVIGNLLINAAASKLGESATRRFEKMKELGDHFEEFEAVTDRMRDGRIDR